MWNVGSVAVVAVFTGSQKRKWYLGTGMEVGEVIDGWFRGNYGGL